MKRETAAYRVMMLFLSNAALQTMAFAYRIALGKCAPASALGLNSLMMQIYGIVTSFSISGLNVAVTSLAARTPPCEVRGLLKSALGIFFILWLMLAAPLTALSKSVCAAALGNRSAVPALILMLVCILMTGVENMLKSIHFGRKHVKQCALSELCEQTVRFVLVLLLIEKLGDGTDSGTVFLIMLGMAGSEFVSIGVLSRSFIKLYGKRNGAKCRGNARDLVRVAFPAALTSLSSELFEAVGSLMLPGALMRVGLDYGAALAEIGVINTIAVPFTFLPMSFIGALSAVVLPEAAELNSCGNSPSKLIKKALFAAFAVGVSCAALMIAFSGKISGGLLGRPFDGTVLVLLVLRAVTAELNAVCTAVLNGLLKQKSVLAIAVSGEAMRLAAVLLLAPVLGMRGYALGLLLGGGFRMLLALGTVRSASKMGMEKNVGL